MFVRMEELVYGCFEGDSFTISEELNYCWNLANALIFLSINNIESFS